MNDRPHGQATALLVMTVLPSFLLMGLGLWDEDRGAASEVAVVTRRAQIERTVAALEARPAASAKSLDIGAQFTRDGQTYVGALALAEARAERAQVARAVTLTHLRRHLPRVMVLCGGLFGAFAVLVLATTTLMARFGRRSRETLVRNFDLVRRSLPATMAAQVLLATVGAIAAIGFEALGVPLAGWPSLGSKLLIAAALVIVASLWTAIKAVSRLRRVSALFDPTPMSIMGVAMPRDAAPGLWRMLDDLAKRLGALPVDNVIAGLDGGFFVTAGPKLLKPGAHAIEGRTLYFPVPYAPLLREDEVAAILAHELAHFAGDDLTYSARFLPTYVGVDRTLHAIVHAGTDRNGSLSPLVHPALRLSLFVMERFDHAVQHWSRLREIAADGVSARLVSSEATARALLRTGPARAAIDPVLANAYRTPDAAPPDLVAAIAHAAIEQGLPSTPDMLDDREPHPTDTHPTGRQRVAALDVEPGPAALSEATAPPPHDAPARLRRFFAEPDPLCRALTAQFVAAARNDAQATRGELEAVAASIGSEPLALHENSRSGGRFLVIAGVVLGLVSLAALAAGVPGLGETAKLIVAAIAGGAALLYIPLGLAMLRRSRTPFLILRSDSITIDGLEEALLWDDVHEIVMSPGASRIRAAVTIRPGAPLPKRARSGRRVKLDRRQHATSFAVPTPREAKLAEVPDLVGRYYAAHEARQAIESLNRDAVRANPSGKC